LLVIRLTRFGKKKQPFYRIVIADRRAPIQGKYIEKIGHFNPLDNKARLFVDKKRAEKWLKNGAKPSDTVHNLLVEAGILKKKIITKYKRSKKSHSAKATRDKEKTKEASEVGEKPPEKAENKEKK